MKTSFRFTKKREGSRASFRIPRAGTRCVRATKRPIASRTWLSIAPMDGLWRGGVTIAENLAAVESRITAACKRAGRKRSDVTLVAVSKTFGADRVEEAIDAGVTHIGENRVQEARDKKPQVRGAARWHLIGHLQSNKAKDAVRIFDVIETVDSVELAQKIARASDTARDVLLQEIGRAHV